MWQNWGQKTNFVCTFKFQGRIPENLKVLIFNLYLQVIENGYSPRKGAGYFLDSPLGLYNLKFRSMARIFSTLRSILVLGHPCRMTASNADHVRLHCSDKWYFSKLETERGTSQTQEARNEHRKFGGTWFLSP